MAQVLNPRPLTTAVSFSSSTLLELSRVRLSSTTRHHGVEHSWSSLQRNLKCNGKFSCLFSDNRKQEQARRALEGALGGKKTEFEKWDKEIKKREETGGGGDGGGGGWFRWGRWFGGSNGDNFWQEAQQTSLAVLGIIVMYLIVAKGEVMLAVFFNPLLFALRGTRNMFTLITSQILKKVSPNSHANFADIPKEEAYTRVSAKERVVRKWGSD
ncbi:hypothetical protein F0562_018795 [Nyssa sinensis]|uniref:Uncharacterized protein n=1 Tax=Nyssa sinensis TaxID=561372 RepID=A0A5J4ZCU1_9ASTE|nr:hypothetical protein F0562_018795 [Nyssa sinensis]